MVTPELAPGALDFLRRFIQDRRWRFAKTYAATAPHEYTARKWKPEPRDQADFDAFVRATRECGYARRWHGQVYHTLNVDGFMYWTMGAPIPATVVVNRAALEAAARGRAARRGRRGGQAGSRDFPPPHPAPADAEGEQGGMKGG